MDNEITKAAHEARKAGHEIHPLILGRWSPRAMTGEAISEKELMRLFEAARWAPSSYNSQPWRFLYAKRDTEHWQAFFDLLTEGNGEWTKNAAVLMVVITEKNFKHNNKPNRTATFTSGSAWQNLALQAADMGLVAHGMAGFDVERARQDLEIPQDYVIEAMIAVGKKAEMAETVTDRKPLQEIIMEGKYQDFTDKAK